MTPGNRRLGYKILSWARLCLAVTLLALFIRVYTSPLLQWAELRSSLMGLQLSSALVRGGVLAFASLLWLLLAAIFGRWYCGSVCPMGTAQEVTSRAVRRIFHKNFSYISPWPFRYCVVLLSLAAGGAALGFAHLDPITNFGHGMRYFFTLLTESAAAVPPLWAIIFVIVLAFAAARGRRFCDWCPIGVLLGSFSLVAPFGMRLDEKRCVSCGECERACPMNCVDSKNKIIERGRCVMCLSCAGACRLGAVDYGFVSPVKVKIKEGRRTFFENAGVNLAFASSVLYLLKAVFPRFLYGFISHTQPGFIGVILPPGAGDADNFKIRCIGCQSCTAACPVGILRSGSGLKPEMDYSRGYCQYNCTECGKVCPTGAIRALSREEKQKTRIALSDYTKPNCVAVTRGESCGACAEVCPTHALRMVPVGAGPLTVPEFDPEYCIGCGGCLNVCPAEPKVFAVRGVTPQVLTPGMRAAASGDEAETGTPFKAGEAFPF